MPVFRRLCRVYGVRLHFASPLYALLAYFSRGAKEAPRMGDILVIVLGTGAILLMAAYAELCERI
jgi:hypothetical protein